MEEGALDVVRIGDRDRAAVVRISSQDILIDSWKPIGLGSCESERNTKRQPKTSQRSLLSALRLTMNQPAVLGSRQERGDERLCIFYYVILYRQKNIY